jgi:hypothetical protein
MEGGMINVNLIEHEIPLEDPEISEVFHGIVEKCLWHEPHSFPEILEKTNHQDASEPEPQGRYNRRRAYISLLAACNQGYVGKSRGYFHLTAAGRKKFSENNMPEPWAM